MPDHNSLAAESTSDVGSLVGSGVSCRLTVIGDAETTRRGLGMRPVLPHCLVPRTPLLAAFGRASPVRPVAHEMCCGLRKMCVTYHNAVPIEQSLGESGHVGALTTSMCRAGAAGALPCAAELCPVRSTPVAPAGVRSRHVFGRVAGLTSTPAAWSERDRDRFSIGEVFSGELHGG